MVPSELTTFYRLSLRGSDKRCCTVVVATFIVVVLVMVVLVLVAAESSLTSICDHRSGGNVSS